MKTIFWLTLATLAIVAALAPLPASAQTDEALPTPGQLERFGEAAADAAVLEAALGKVAARAYTTADRRDWEAAMERIARLSPEGRTEQERRRLANAWQRMAQLAHALDGPTSEYLNLLEVACGLDPDDEVLRREIDYQRRRRAVLAARVAEAGRVRAAREAGRDPYHDTSYIGGDGQRGSPRPGN